MVQISFIASICSRIFFGRVSSHIPGELKQALDKAAAKYELKVFSGTQYGFCFPERAVFDTIAAEAADPRKGPGSSGLFHQLSFVQHYVEDHHFRVGFEIWRRVQQFSYQ